MFKYHSMHNYFNNFYHFRLIVVMELRLKDKELQKMI